MYIVNDNKEKIKIEDMDSIENFEAGGKSYDNFGFAAFIISTVTLIFIAYMWWSDRKKVASVSDLSPIELKTLSASLKEPLENNDMPSLSNVQLENKPKIPTPKAGMVRSRVSPRNVKGKPSPRSPKRK